MPASKAAIWKDQICREQRRASEFCGGGAGERYVSNRMPCKELSAEATEPMNADHSATLGVVAA
jgi:hypothetical protein